MSVWRIPTRAKVLRDLAVPAVVQVVLTLGSIWEAYNVEASGSTTRVHCFGAAHCLQHQTVVDAEIRIEDEEVSESKSKVDDIVEEQQHRADSATVPGCGKTQHEAYQ